MFENKNTSELESNILFSGIKQELATNFANPKNIIGKREGDVIFQKGEPCEYFYLLVEGIVKLKFTEPDGTNIYVEKNKDSFFGEFELLKKSPRKSSAVADTDCRMYTFNLSELKSLIKSNANVLKNLKDNLTFYIPEDDFDNYTKDFAGEKDGEPEFSKTTEKISFNEPNDTNEDTAQQAEIMEEKEPPQEDSSDTETENSDELITDSEDNFEFSEPEELEESENYFKLSDPRLKEKELNEIKNPEADTDQEIPSKEHNPSFTDIGFDDTFGEQINEEKAEDSRPGFDSKEEPGSEIKKNSENETMDEKQIPLPDKADSGISTNDKTSVFYKDIINRIQNIYSSINLDEVINIIAEESADLVNAEGGVLYILDKENEELFSKVLSGNSINTIRMKLSDGLQGIAAVEKRNIFVEDPGNEKYYNPVIEDLTGIKFKNALYYPLIRNNKETAAVLELYNSERGKFTQIDIDILNEISGSAIKAINNTRLADITLQQKRIASIGDLTEFISEDIKNPLLLIKHYVSLIKKKKIAPEIGRVLDLQIEQINSVEDFLKSSEAYAKGKNVVELSTININEALTTTLGLLAEYVESRNMVILRKTETDALVNLDNGQFYQACYQVVKNSCDEMSEEGKIYVTSEKDGEYIKIKFRDTGAGIPENWKEKIFKPFTGRKKNKAGLGLTIAEKIIADHGGYIMVDSVIGQGTTFIIALPIVF